MPTPPSSRPTEHRPWRGLWIPVLIILLWSAVQLVRDPAFFWGDDCQSYFSPIYHEIVRSWHDGEWPLLSRNSWAAGNLAGEFQNATFSIPFNALLVAIWALPLAIPLKAAALAIIHLMWLAAGVFVLGRQRGLPTSLATAAALATSLSGWMIDWAATNWITFLTGFCWVPWVWWSLQVAITGDSDRSVWKRWLRPGICVALLVTEGNAFAAIEVALITTWLALQSLSATRSLRALAPLAVAALIGTGLSAPAWWMLIEMLQSSTRGAWGNTLHHAWSVPWSAWPGLVLPSVVTQWQEFTGPRAHTSIELACGLFPIAALASALLFRPLATARALRWEIGLLIACAVVVSLPSIGQFRWSFRWLPLFHLLLALIAAEAWHRGLATRSALTAVGLVGLTWIGTVAVGQNDHPSLAVAYLLIAVAWGLIDRFTGREIREWTPTAVVTLTLAGTFWILPHHQSVPRFSFSEGILNPAPLDPHRLYLSLHSGKEIGEARSRPPGFGNIVRPANSMEYAGLRFLNGYSAFAGTEIKSWFSSHGEVDRPVAESLAGPDGERVFAFLGVDGIVFADDYLPLANALGPEWKKVAEAPEGAVFHREPARFRPVKVLSRVVDRPQVPLATPQLEILAERRNSVTVRVTPASHALDPNADELGSLGHTTGGIAPIAFVRPFLAGYQAFFNGQPVDVRAYHRMLPLVELPANASGILELRYRPRGLVGGLTIAGFTAVAMLLIAMAGRRTRSHPRSATGEGTSHRAPFTRTQKALIYALFLAALAIVFLAGAEIILGLQGVKPWKLERQAIGVEPGGRFYQAHPTLGYTHLPGHFSVTLGTGYSFEVTHLPNTLRVTHVVDTEAAPRPEIWVFGCSFTHGWTLNDHETYPWLLQERFPAYEVVNFGVSGYGTIQSLLQFKEALKSRSPQKPRVAVLAYAGFHDQRNTFSRTFRKDTAPWDFLGPRTQPYARLDAAGHLTYHTADILYPEFPLMRRLALAHFVEMKYNEQELRWNRSHAVSEALVLEMAALAKEHGVTFVLANIAEGAPMLDFAQQHSIPRVDISTDLSLPQNTNLPHDPHPSAQANRIYAEKLGAYLTPILQ